MRRKPKQTFLQRRQTVGQQASKRHSTLLIIREMQIKITTGYHLTPVRIASIKNSVNSKCWRVCGKREPSYTAGIVDVVTVLDAQSRPTLLRPHGLWPARLLCLRNTLGRINGVGSQSLPQGIFLTQGSCWVSCTAGRFFTI